MTPPSDSPLTRRSFGLGGLLLTGAALTACGSSGSSGGSAGSAGWTPVEVTHQFGTTTVDQRPTRVVSAGLTEQDFALALGVKPVGVTEWYDEYPYATWPWAQSALGSDRPKVLDQTDGLQLTEIAALRPDLILAVNSGLKKSDYDKLSAIAPTIAPASADEGYFAPWTTMLAPIAKALGKPEQGKQIETDIKAQFADAAKAHPEFAGTKTIFLQGAPYDGSLLAYPDGTSTAFLTDLGLNVPGEIDRYVKGGEAQAYIPTERISVLDAADVLIWATEGAKDKAALQKIPGFSDLAAVKAGRAIYTDKVLAGAIYFASPLSLPYVVDKLVPELASALA